MQVAELRLQHAAPMSSTDRDSTLHRDLRAAHFRTLVGPAEEGVAADSLATSHALACTPPTIDGGTQTSALPRNTQELPQLLRTICSALFVESGHQPSRVIIALDAALPLVAAEFCREGARLLVRLRVRDQAAARVVLAQADALELQIAQSTSMLVTVDVTVGAESHEFV